jgi:thioesterase domain-containing protein/acyl carrier protein
LGVRGELCVGGDGLALGYWNLPEETLQKFAIPPASPVGNLKLYRTGDYVRLLPNRELEFLGRLDHQVKVRGHRIELSEVETIIRKNKDIQECAVVVDGASATSRQLVAYIVKHAASTSTATDLRRWLEQSLPHYMVPHRFVELLSLPLTANGKINRRLLPLCTQVAAKDAIERVPPRDRLEHSLACIWCRILKLEGVGVDDDFFDLGGHSLLSLHLVAEIKRELGHQVPPSAVLNCRTIKQMALLISSNSVTTLTSKLLTLQQSGDKPPLVFMPSLGGTARFWKEIIEHWAPDRPVYSLGLVDDTVHWPDGYSLEEIAASYVNGFESLSPDAPIHLAGYSFGGTLAAEVARQLRLGGRRVGTIVAIDASPGTLPKQGPVLSFQSAWWFLQNLPFWLTDKVVRNSWRKCCIDVWRRMKFAKRADGRASTYASTVQSVVDTRGLPEAHVRRMQIAYDAVQRYAALPYAGDVVVIRARTSPLLDSLRPDLGWKEIATGRVRVLRVPGNHSSMLEKRHAERLTRCIRESIVDPC